MCDYCIESGFVFDFWQHGLFNLPEPYRNDGGEIAIDLPPHAMRNLKRQTQRNSASLG